MPGSSTLERASASEELTTIVDAARAGDHAAFGRLVDRFDPMVVRIAIRITRCPDDARDVSQQTWMLLFHNLDTIRCGAGLPGWLATTTRREALRVVRGRGAATPLEPADADRIPDHADGPEARAERSETIRLVRRALHRLPREHAELLVELVGHCRPYAEVSSSLGRPMGSLGPLRARYLRQLAAALDG